MHHRLAVTIALAGLLAVPAFGQTTTSNVSQPGPDEIHGSGTVGHLSKFTGTHAVGNSGVVENGGTLTTSEKLSVGAVTAITSGENSIALHGVNSTPSSASLVLRP